MKGFFILTADRRVGSPATSRFPLAIQGAK